MIAEPRTSDEIGGEAFRSNNNPAEQRVAAPTAGGIDDVPGGSGGLLMHQRSKERSRARETATPAAILDALPASTALIDASGEIFAVNNTWRRFAQENGMRGDDAHIGLKSLESLMCVLAKEVLDSKVLIRLPLRAQQEVEVWKGETITGPTTRFDRIGRAGVRRC